uniref:Putative salivary secreted protein n=1 Tax=Ornithodoros turicata TaxID=34597 RepID=A0A2R5LEK7_9ACAR
MNFLLVILVAMPLLVYNSDSLSLPGAQQLQGIGTAMQSMPGANEGMTLMTDAVNTLTGHNGRQSSGNQQSEPSTARQ